jgi:heme/copper-type cytochrome/quinol oxidase subunit 4
MSSAQGFFLAALVTLLPCVVLTAVGFFLVDGNQAAGIGLILGAGVLQLAWVIPMFRHAKQIQNEGMKIGLVLCGSLVFLFSASCGGLLWALSNTTFH